MEIPPATAVYLHLLDLETDHGEGFATSLTRLAGDLAREVPSLLAVSLTVDRLGHEIAVTALAPGATRFAVASSLAVPLSSGGGESLLLQAAEPGTFILIADDLAGLIDAGRLPLELDRHLHVPLPTVDPAASPVDTLAELQSVNQAIGVLLDQGATGADAALADLRRRASTTGSTIGAVSRRLLADLRPRSTPTDP